MAKTAKAPKEQQQHLPLGVYTSEHRNTAIAIKRTERGLWYLTMEPGFIDCLHSSEEKFKHDFPFPLATYPVRRAVRLYENSHIRRDERVQKILHRLLERL